jgi:hypothetical protein
MTLNYKYTILYTFFSLFLFWLIIKYGSSVCNSKLLIEGLSNGRDSLIEFEKYSQQIIPYPKDAVINYNDINSPLYSRNVNMPINDPISCKNFCGPNAKCLLTKEQCTSDIDCQGCNPGPTPRDECLTKDVDPYDAAGKLGQNQGLQYSSLTTGYNKHNADFAQIYEGSKENQLKRSYEGVDLWTDTFNKGLELYNRKRKSTDKYSEGVSQQTEDESSNMSGSQMNYNEMKYPMKISATGLFYETTPPASNASIG